MSDNYLYDNIQVFTDETKALSEFERQCHNALEVCQNPHEIDEEDEDYEANIYAVREQKGKNAYEVQSDAFERYQIKVALTEEVVDCA